MKRLSLALAAIGLSAGAFAALPAATDPTIVNVPQLPGGFVVGISGYYLQSSNSNGDLDYATVNTSNATTFNGSASVFGSSLTNVDPGYDWGWGVNVGYIFPNTGNDINLSYFQLDTSDTASVSNGPLNGISPVVNNFNFPILTFFGVPNNFANSASAKAEYDINQVDLTAGQYINVGCRLSLHPYAGLRWAEIDRKLNSSSIQSQTQTITLVDPDIIQSITQTVSFAETSDFQGIGPIAGLDASYYVGMGFGIVGHFDSALLVGDIDASTHEFVDRKYTTNTIIITPPNHENSGSADFSAGNTRRVVPVLDGKLGVDYTYVFNNSANSDITIELGWQTSEYFDSVDRLHTDTNIVENNGSNASPISSASLTGRTTSNVGLNGPYASVVLHV